MPYSLNLKNIVDLVHLRAQQQPDVKAYTFLADGGNAEVDLSYSELHLRAIRIAGTLKSNGATPGTRARRFFWAVVYFMLAVFLFIL